MTTRLMPVMVIAAVLACGSGCAKPDWIQQTLVTVDVTGTWVRAGTVFVLKLVQEGQRVTGSIVVRGSPGNFSGTIEGIVSGDVFRFKQTSGTIWLHESEMTVIGDEMTGRLNAPGTSSVVSTLQRVDSARLTSQP